MQEGGKKNKLRRLKYNVTVLNYFNQFEFQVQFFYTRAGNNDTEENDLQKGN